MKSSSEHTQIQKPLDGKSPSQAQSGETWKPYGPNPSLEVNNKGQLRTKIPLPKANALDLWGLIGKRG